MPAPRLPRPAAFAAAVAFAVCALVACGIPRPAAAQTVDPQLWGANGEVEAIARVGHTLFLGGRFQAVGPCTGGGVPVDRATGAPRAAYPHVAGRVSAVVPDGAGGWYLGGHFAAVEGQARAHIAHVRADGTLDAWAPMVVGQDGVAEEGRAVRRAAGVGALVLRGNTLYVGGRFDHVNGVARRNLAALDATTGAVLAWDPDADGEVRCLVAQGGTLYAGGDFGHLGGLERRFIAALDLKSGAPTPWNPGAEWTVRALAVDGRTIWAGGDFQEIGGLPRNGLAALDATSGRATDWDAALRPLRKSYPHGDWVWPFVSALAVRGRTLYASGYFDSAQGQARRYLAALDTRTGALETRFAPGPSSWATAIVPAGGVLYVGGDWYSLRGDAVPHVAALDPATGQATAWNPRANGLVEALAVDATTVYVGGGFTSLGDWELRNGFAALDLTTGRLSDFDPGVTGPVRHLFAIGDTLYLSGPFGAVGGKPRATLAAVDARTGAVTDWDPGGLGMGGAIAGVHGRLVWVVGRTARPTGFAQLDAVTAQPTAFDAHLDGSPGDLAQVGDAIYMAGDFVHVGGVLHAYLAAVDATTGALLPWNPMANPAEFFITGFDRVAARAGAVYLGGNFNGTDWFPRRDLAAVDAGPGALLPWDPEPAGDDDWSNETEVRRLVVRGDDVWVGGNFLRIAGEPRAHLAVLDAATGAALPLDLGLDGPVGAIVPYGDTVYVGGRFESAGGMPHEGALAVVLPAGWGARARTPAAGDAAVAAAREPALALGPCRPNPLRAPGGAIAFTLPRAAAVTLALHDLRGRRMATLLDRAPLSAGAHEARLDAAALRAGVYFLRLEAGGSAVTRKVVAAP